MASYYLRSKDGILKARLTGHAASLIFNEGDGFFRKAKYTTGETKTVFELTDCSKFEVMGITVFLWEGDTLVWEGK